MVGWRRVRDLISVPATKLEKQLLQLTDFEWVLGGKCKLRASAHFHNASLHFSGATVSTFVWKLRRQDPLMKVLHKELFCIFMYVAYFRVVLVPKVRDCQKGCNEKCGI